MKLSIKIAPHDTRANSLAVISLLGGWLLVFPYNGHIVYTLSTRIQIDGTGLLELSLFAQVIGLLIGGMLISTMKAAKRMITASLLVCMLITLLVAFAPHWVGAASLLLCGALMGAAFASCGHFVKFYTASGLRFSAAADVIISISVLKTIVNLTSRHLSYYAGAALSMAILGMALFLMFRIPEKPSAAILCEADGKVLARALTLLCIFISVIAFDFGVMMEIIAPKYRHVEWLSSWYWVLPYAGAAMVMKRLPKSADRDNLLYAAIAMIGFGFICYLLLEKTVLSYLITFMLLMAAWAVYDVFWWSMLGEIFSMRKNAALILGVGFGVNALGMLGGKTVASYQPLLTDVRSSLLMLAVISATLVILPLLHRSLACLLPEQEATTAAPEGPMQAAAPEMGALTEREKQIVSLLLKGRTCRLIADELYLSENTVKTHIKNIYSKLGVRCKSDLFSKMIP